MTGNTGNVAGIGFIGFGFFDATPPVEVSILLGAPKILQNFYKSVTCIRLTELSTGDHAHIRNLALLL